LAYRALYRAYRPQRFAEVVGQEHVVRTLQNALRQGRVGHAYLFAGPRGTGKTSVARLLARAVNCEQPLDGGEPCNQCAACRSIADGSALDVIEIDAASNRGIEEIRDLREKVRYAPGRCRYKVYIIDEVHMLTEHAFNALLKTLEEPPANVVFILATTDPQKVPATILSRCQRFDFHRVPDARIIAHLEQVCAAEGLTAEPEALQVIARHARGGLRDALSLLDQAAAMASEGAIALDDLLALLGTAGEESLLALTRAAAGGDLAAGLAVIDQVLAQGRDPRQILRDWQEYLRHALLLRLDAGLENAVALSGRQAEELRRACAGVDPERLLDFLDYLAEREQVMRWAPDGRLVLETAFLRAARELGAGTGAPGAAAPAAGAGQPPAAAVQQARAAVDETETAAQETGAAAGEEPAAGEAGGIGGTGEEGGDAAAVVAAWPAVLERVRKLSTQTWALLNPADVEVRAAGPSRVELVFRHEFHYNTMVQGKRLQTVERAIADTCGVRVALRCVTMEQDADEPSSPARRRRGREAGRPAGRRENEAAAPAREAAGGTQAGAPPGGGMPADPVPLPDEPPLEDLPGEVGPDRVPPGGGAADRPQEPGAPSGLAGDALELFGGRLVEPREDRP